MYNFKIKGGEHENDSNHRDQLIRDMIYVCCLPHLSEKNRREFIDVSISWSYSDRFENNIEKNAKYKGCPYWSEEALKRINDKGNWAKGSEKDKGLRHEHIVPRKIFIDAMMVYFKNMRDRIKTFKDLETESNKAFEKLKVLMDKNLKGCVVTKMEAEAIDGKVKGEQGPGEYNSKMPDAAYKNGTVPKNDWEKFSEITNPWARYETALAQEKGIKIYELEWDVQNTHWKLQSKKVNISTKKCTPPMLQ